MLAWLVPRTPAVRSTRLAGFGPAVAQLTKLERISIRGAGRSPSSSPTGCGQTGADMLPSPAPGHSLCRSNASGNQERVDRGRSPACPRQTLLVDALGVFAMPAPQALDSSRAPGTGAVCCSPAIRTTVSWSARPPGGDIAGHTPLAGPGSEMRPRPPEPPVRRPSPACSSLPPATANRHRPAAH